MSEARQPAEPGVRPSLARDSSTANAPSAGIPQADVAADGDRIAELEARLARLERSVSLRGRGRDVLGRVIPREAGVHFSNAGREQLLGIRSIVDFWIARIDSPERGGRPGSRERIEVEGPHTPRDGPS